MLEDRTELEDFYANQISEVYVILPAEAQNDSATDELN